MCITLRFNITLLYHCMSYLLVVFLYLNQHCCWKLLFILNGEDKLLVNKTDTLKINNATYYIIKIVNLKFNASLDMRTKYSVNVFLIENALFFLMILQLNNCSCFNKYVQICEAHTIAIVLQVFCLCVKNAELLLHWYNILLAVM